MQRFRFDARGGAVVTAFGSRGVRAHPIQHDAARAVVTSLWLEPGGHLGEHEAPVDQLFLVMSGDGWVAGADGQALPLRAGEAAYWRGGERHACGSEGGMVVVVVEGEGLEPERWLRPYQAAP